MISVAQELRDIDDARATLASPTRSHAASNAAIERLRARLMSDSYMFTELICGHEDLIPEIHMPMSYAAAGLTDRLIWSITQTGFESEVIDQIRQQFQARGLDPENPKDRDGIDRALDWQNWRVYRGAFKSSVITHGALTFTATRDPNTTHKIVHAVDPIAWAFCDQIAQTILSGTYRDIFPDRIPEGKIHELITSKHITLGGRTISHPQATIQAAGYTSKDTAAHYDHLWFNDLVVGGEGGNATDALLPGVHGFLRSISGFYMITKRVRQIHEGTRYHENDDHGGYLAKGKNKHRCLSVVIPIEKHDGEVVNILQRGRPTMPTLFPAERITELQARNMSDAADADGAYSWRCNYLLDPAPMGGRLFTSPVVNDPMRSWLGPFNYPNKKFPDRFLVARYARDAEGLLIDVNDKRKSEAGPQWKPKVIMLDPWRDVDVVATLDPSWKEGGNNWAVSVTAIDCDLVKFQLESRSGEDGVEGWIEACQQLADIYPIRVVGYGAGGTQDESVKNFFATDNRLRKLRGRIQAVREVMESKRSRIVSGVSEPLKRYKLLLAPPAMDVHEYDSGAAATRAEMLAYRGVKNDTDGIIDSLSMVNAVLHKPLSPEQRDRIREQLEKDSIRRRRMIDPVLGVRFAA